MRTKAGMKKRYVAIYGGGGSPDGQGGATGGNGEKLGHLYASVETLTDQQRFFMGRESADAKLRLRTCYNSQVTKFTKLSLSGRMLKITGIINVNEANKELVIICKEDTSGG